MNLENILDQFLEDKISIEQVLVEFDKINYELNDIYNEKNVINYILDRLSNYISENEEKIKKAGENFSQVEYFGRMLLLNFFQKTGIFIKSSERITKEEIKKKINLSAKYEQLFEVLLLILEKENFIKIINNEVITQNIIESDELKENFKNLNNFKNDLIDKYPDMSPHFNLLEICIGNYNYILSGQKSADGIMFPVYSMELVEGIFRNNILADYFNILISKAIIYYIEYFKKYNKKIKILEIGAGSGGTSVFILDSIKNFNNIEYYFTDISKVFVKGAEKKYKEKYQFSFYKKLDISDDLESQGFNLYDFDIIVGSNVIHSTTNIIHTLSNIKKLVSEQGILLINEVTGVQDFTTLTFGLLSGWWNFTDKEKRLPNSPLLNIQEWKKSLNEAGFKNINLISTTDQDKKDSFSQSLFISQNNLNNSIILKSLLEKLKKNIINKQKLIEIINIKN